MNDSPAPESSAVRSATLKTGVARVTIHGVPHEAGVAARIFSEISRQKINIDDIIENASNGGRNVIVAFILDAKQLDAAKAVAESIAADYTGAKVEVTRNLARLRVVGMGMRSHSGVAAKLFEAIATEGINIENISTSEIVISLLVAEKDGKPAQQAVQKAFDLEPPAPASDEATPA
jgi:aspartate kinase